MTHTNREVTFSFRDSLEDSTAWQAFCCPKQVRCRFAVNTFHAQIGGPRLDSIQVSDFRPDFSFSFSRLSAMKVLGVPSQVELLQVLLHHLHWQKLLHTLSHNRSTGNQTHYRSAFWNLPKKKKTPSICVNLPTRSLLAVVYWKHL